MGPRVRPGRTVEDHGRYAAKGRRISGRGKLRHTSSWDERPLEQQKPIVAGHRGDRTSSRGAIG